MVNIDDFIKRLEVLLDYYGLNASAFADKIGVQRSSLSHLLSGRNKPSLDFILKIIEEFPEVDLYWILNGKGHFPKTNENPHVSENNFNEVSKSNTPPLTHATITNTDLFSEVNPNQSDDGKSSIPKEDLHQNKLSECFSSDVEKIIFFYKDGTFKVFNPR